jgi:hypothetical protein
MRPLPTDKGTELLVGRWIPQSVARQGQTVHFRHPIVVRAVEHHPMTVRFQEGGLSQENLILSAGLLVSVVNRQNLHRIQNTTGDLQRFAMKLVRIAPVQDAHSGRSAQALT